MLHLIHTVKREEWPLAYPILPKEKKSSWVFFLFIFLINLRTSSHPFDWKMSRGKREHLDKGKRKRKLKIIVVVVVLLGQFPERKGHLHTSV